MRIARLVLIICLAISLAPFAIAQVQDSTEYRSGYGDIQDFGGPDGPAQSVKSKDEQRKSTFESSWLQDALIPYFKLKTDAKKDAGFTFGVQYYLLPQVNTEDTDKTAGGIFRFTGNWTLFGRNGGNTGRIEYRFEHRAGVLGAESPNNVSNQIGMRALSSGFGYNDPFAFDLAVINWTQTFNKNSAGFAVGRMVFDVYMDAFPFQTFSRGFHNRAFILNPTLATTGVGALGAVAKGFISKSLWIGGQIHDANAVSGSFDIDTIKEGEFLKAVEIGWTPNFASRKKRLVQFTYWVKDARELAGTTKGSGIAMSAGYQLENGVFPFIRGGISDGGAGVAADASMSVGAEFPIRYDQSLSLGFGWARITESANGIRPNDEMVLEAGYRIQLTQIGSITPDVQVLFNPANNPAADVVVVGGIRMIWFL